jgi:hypothetical protein
LSDWELFDTLEGATKSHLSEATIEQVKAYYETAIADRKKAKAVGIRYGHLTPQARLSIRRMLSRYWFNESPFALDLVGAVIRQGSFIDKMHNIDWLHSPALAATMSRLIEKYERFFDLIRNNPRQLVVPTLDVDLAWHTDQLNPKNYYNFCLKQTTPIFRIIDHDDKIGEADLTDAFEWTSKAYAQKYGEAYSQCTCWYCEAVRESNTSSFRRLLKKDDIYQPEAGCPSDPLKSAHISAHNAVKFTDAAALTKARVKAAELDKAYHKACARARKNGRNPPPRDEYFYAYAYGYPYFFPIYYPYAVDPCIGGATYAAPVASADSSSGSYGACAAGTCSGIGGCGGGGGGGAGGSCGGGSSGGCGGGGGGGCGGKCSRCSLKAFQANAGIPGGGGGGCGGKLTRPILVDPLLTLT